MDELLKKVAAEMGYPEAMVERSARARAKAEGTTVESVLSVWSGGEPVSGDDAAAAEPAAPAAPAPAAAPAAAEPAAPPEDDEVEVLEARPAAQPGPEAPPEPAAAKPEPVPAGSIPGWMVAAFVLIPFIALLYAMNVPNGPDCGQAGSLAVDPVTGLAVNCDGSPYGVDIVNFFTIGEELYTSQACAGCHGAGGGGGTGPAFVGGAVLATFPAGQCSDHIEWVRLGSAGWPDPTYGANAKPVGGSGANMPAYPGLSDEDIAAVVLYERVAFGGEPLAEAEADCGLSEADVSAAGG
jgi:hypothetical protein